MSHQRDAVSGAIGSEVLLLRAFVLQLLEQGLFNSAEVAGSVLLCRCSAGGGSQQEVTTAEALALYADALKGQGEHKRATSYYKKALQHRKLQLPLRGSGLTDSGVLGSPGMFGRVITSWTPTASSQISSNVIDSNGFTFGSYNNNHHNNNNNSNSNNNSSNIFKNYANISTPSVRDFSTSNGGGGDGGGARLHFHNGGGSDDGGDGSLNSSSTSISSNGIVTTPIFASMQPPPPKTFIATPSLTTPIAASSTPSPPLPQQQQRQLPAHNAFSTPTAGEGVGGSGGGDWPPAISTHVTGTPLASAASPVCTPTPGGGSGQEGWGAGGGWQTHKSSAAPQMRVADKDKEKWQESYVEEAKLKFKEAQCLVAGGETGAAITTLESILLFARTVDMNICLAKTYEGAGLKRNAANCYRHALRQNPLATEAILPLLRTGTTTKEVVDIMRAHMHTVPMSPPLEAVPWVLLLIEACACLYTNQSAEALQHFVALEAESPQNLFALLGMGLAYVDMERWDEAQTILSKARLVDYQILESMDHLAYALYKRGDVASLNRLAHDLLTIDSKRAEPWIATALYTDLKSRVKGDNDKAITLVDKALQLKPRHAMGYTVKGELMFAAEKFDLAHLSFLQASNIQKCIRVYRGLVESCLALHKYSDAASIAKEALSSMPKSPGAVILMGKVLAHTSHNSRDGNERAKKAFRKALAMDPMCLEAIMALTDCLIGTEDYEECTQLLQGALQCHSVDMLHTKMGQVFTLRKMYGDALAYYHLALELNPASADAQQGLDRVEKLMRGGNPNEEDDDGDGDNDDDDDDMDGDSGYTSPVY